MDATEDDVGWLVPATALPPTFDDTPVVPVNPDVRELVVELEERASKKLEADRFSPSDIPAFTIPTCDEAPRSPTTLDDDANADPGAGVRVGTEIGDLVWTWNLSLESGGREGIQPP